jgi:large subunit ribosomal protein L11
MKVTDSATMAAAAKEILRRPVAATIRLTVPAGGARPAPPVGPALGQYRLNLMAFCKDFNARTQKYKPDTPMAVTITAFKDNSFEFTVKSPTVSWYIKKAAGVDKGSTRPGHLSVTTLSVRHVYEIAKVKQTDPFCQYMPLESICKSIIGTANSMGIKIVQDLE